MKFHKRYNGNSITIYAGFIRYDLSGGGIAYQLGERVIVQAPDEDTVWLDSFGLRDIATLKAMKWVLENHSWDIKAKENRWWLSETTESFQYHDGVVLSTNGTIQHHPEACVIEDDWLARIEAVGDLLHTYLLFHPFAPTACTPITNRRELRDILAEPAETNLETIMQNAMTMADIKWEEVSQKLTTPDPLVKIAKRYARLNMGLVP